jgi:hypothetical protein
VYHPRKYDIVGDSSEVKPNGTLFLLGDWEPLKGGATADKGERIDNRQPKHFPLRERKKHELRGQISRDEENSNIRQIVAAKTTL